MVDAAHREEQVQERDGRAARPHLEAERGGHKITASRSLRNPLPHIDREVRRPVLVRASFSRVAGEGVRPERVAAVDEVQTWRASAARVVPVVYGVLVARNLRRGEGDGSRPSRLACGIVTRRDTAARREERAGSDALPNRPRPEASRVDVGDVEVDAADGQGGSNSPCRRL